MNFLEHQAVLTFLDDLGISVAKLRRVVREPVGVRVQTALQDRLELNPELRERRRDVKPEADLGLRRKPAVPARVRQRIVGDVVVRPPFVPGIDRVPGVVPRDVFVRVEVLLNRRDTQAPKHVGVLFSARVSSDAALRETVTSVACMTEPP